MIDNRSVPANAILPHLTYQDLPTAIDWLTRTFGFIEHYRYGDPIAGAQLHLGNAWIMVSQIKPELSTPSILGRGTQYLTVFVEDVEAHFERTRATGALLFEDLHETVYGELQYGVEDLDGHRWLFSRHARDLSPADWGATIINPSFRLAELPRPRFCYLEIPTTDLKRSVAFYESVFAWKIRNRDTGRPSFDDAAKDISGAWISGRTVSRDPGLLPYIWVDSIDATSSRITAHGGEVLQSAQLDSPGGQWVATFRDPSGNILGLYQEGPR